MARAAAAPRILEAALPEVEEEAQSTEELLPQLREKRCWSRVHPAMVSLILAALAACMLLAAAKLLTRAPPSAPPVTIRQLLADPELADVVTENFMSVSHGLLRPAQRGEIRAAVAENLANISGSIRERLPADHAKLGLLRISPEQRSTALKLLRLYGDPRLQRLSSKISEAMAEMEVWPGGREGLKHRLAEELQPQLRELQQLCDDLVPGTGERLTLDEIDMEDLVPPLARGEGYPRARINTASRASRGSDTKTRKPASEILAGRRLMAKDTLGGTREQTTTLLTHLEGVLGESMPRAPARMLLFDKQKQLEAETTGWERMLTCFKENISNPKDLFDCLMTNCKRAMTWLIKKLHLTNLLDSISPE